jgi:hypothetical protein
MEGKILSPKTIFKKNDKRITGKNNHNWNGGKPKCKDCGKPISYSSKKHRVIRCKSCSRKGVFSWLWKGGKFKTGSGYIYILNRNHPNATKNGYVFEHRLVAEKKIGRYLNKFEHVHHLNGIKDDNRPENLEVINGYTHSLITKMQTRIIQLEEINKILSEELKKEGFIKALKN